MTPRLHVLTDDAVVSRPDFLERATELLQTIGPRGALHLRTRVLSGSTYHRLAERLIETSAQSGALLVINDRVDVALAAGVGTVQLGSGSLTPAEMLRIAPALRMGISVHDVETAQTLVAEAPNQIAWVMVGHVHETSSHPGEPARGMSVVREMRDAIAAPVIAVGGIRPEHLTPLLQAGADGVAVISGIWGERAPKDAAIRYLSSLW